MERYSGCEVEGRRLYFATPSGGPAHRSALNAAFGAAVTRAGAPVGTTFHDLRHHYASLLISDGRSVKAVQQALGHATAAETLDTYGHLWPAEGDALAGAVERAWRAAEDAAEVG